MELLCLARGLSSFWYNRVVFHVSTLSFANFFSKGVISLNKRKKDRPPSPSETTMSMCIVLTGSKMHSHLQTLFHTECQVIWNLIQSPTGGFYYIFFYRVSKAHEAIFQLRQRPIAGVSRWLWLPLNSREH